MHNIEKGQVWEHKQTKERVKVERLEDSIVLFSGGIFSRLDALKTCWQLVEKPKPSEVNIINPTENDKVLPNMQKHYDNSNGSLYQFCEEKGLNSYEFDIIKRVMRCRKKGLFIEDLEKTKFLIDLYIQEFNHEK